MKSEYTRLKAACYTSNITMAVVSSLSPLLFLTFRSIYGISYSLLGLLVLINFFTQLIVDLIFSFFSHKFNISLTVRVMPVLAVVGFSVYALAPFLFPGNVYLGLLIGTMIFSVASGLAEVLISPIIAAIPAKDPDKEMSKLHAIFAWGAVGVVIFSTLFLFLVGKEFWQILTFILMLIPLSSGILFCLAKIPQMKTPEKTSGALRFLKNKTVWLCMLGIFLGGAAECTMSQWTSGYLEQVFGIPKAVGDILGVAAFAAALGTGRTLYSKIGKNIHRALFLGAIGATLCYLTAALSPFGFLGLFACAFTGFCVSMLWPGSLIVASDYFPDGGVLIYALMAAGGDLGASVGPQLVGLITDFAIENPTIASLAEGLGLSAEQVGMKSSMLVGMLFPLVAIPLFAYFKAQRKKASISEKK
jgi:MFS family permease